MTPLPPAFFTVLDTVASAADRSCGISAANPSPDLPPCRGFADRARCCSAALPRRPGT